MGPGLVLEQTAASISSSCVSGLYPMRGRAGPPAESEQKSTSGCAHSGGDLPAPTEIDAPPAHAVRSIRVTGHLIVV